MTTSDREQAIREIAERGRAARPKSSRSLWIAALVLGTIGVAAFIVIWLVEPDPSTTPARMRESGLGFSTGLVVGLGAGIALGLAIARQRKRTD